MQNSGDAGDTICANFCIYCKFLCVFACFWANFVWVNFQTQSFVFLASRNFVKTQTQTETHDSSSLFWTTRKRAASILSTLKHTFHTQCSVMMTQANCWCHNSFKSDIPRILPNVSHSVDGHCLVVLQTKENLFQILEYVLDMVPLSPLQDTFNWMKKHTNTFKLLIFY